MPKQTSEDRIRDLCEHLISLEQHANPSTIHATWATAQAISALLDPNLYLHLHQLRAKAVAILNEQFYHPLRRSPGLRTARMLVESKPITWKTIDITPEISLTPDYYGLRLPYQLHRDLKVSLSRQVRMIEQACHKYDPNHLAWRRRPRKNKP